MNVIRINVIRIYVIRTNFNRKRRKKKIAFEEMLLELSFETIICKNKTSYK